MNYEKLKIKSINKWEFAVAYPRSGPLSTVSRSNWNLGMLVFVEGGKLENLAKNSPSRDESQPKTQPTLVGGKRSHHCSANPVPQSLRVSDASHGRSHIAKGL